MADRRGGGDRGASPSRIDQVAIGDGAETVAVFGRADGRVAGGGGASRSRRITMSELSDYAHMPNFAGSDNTEAYQGEFEDQEFLAILLSEEHPPLLQELFGQVTEEPAAPAQPNTTPVGALAQDAVVPTLPNNIMAPVEDDVNLHAIRGSDREDEFVMVPFNMILVEQDEENQGNVGDLDSYLREGQWEHTLRLLGHLVAEGEADNGAVEGAPERDIYKAHPELVLWLRGQTYVDIWKAGCTTAAEVYYHEYIAVLYPDGVSAGSSFADTILGSLQKIKMTGSPLRGSKAFVDGEETRQCVEDYLKVYFPRYRPQLRDADSRVWEFGRKVNGTVRCFLCHKEYRGLNLTKLEQHLQGLGHGKQGKCPAVTIYVTRRLEQILAAEDVVGSRRRGPRAVVPPPPLPPPPDAAPDAAAPPPPPDDAAPDAAAPPLPPPDAAPDAAAP